MLNKIDATTKQIIDELYMRLFLRNDCLDDEEWTAIDLLRDSMIRAMPIAQLGKQIKDFHGARIVFDAEQKS